ncbi:hypothetical protein [Horticoccus sp. 23ND18S-11]|uniref:hypothetical protein n=1 Tax=Horticoccus sp. 23ND18S-11 TaxID=3391832 RepID=UPI0039C93DC2
MLEKIIADETWLEGERRGRPVEPTDPVVRHHVCSVVLRVGADLRERAMRELAAENQARIGEISSPPDRSSAAA